MDNSASFAFFAWLIVLAPLTIATTCSRTSPARSDEFRRDGRRWSDFRPTEDLPFLRPRDLLADLRRAVLSGN
jgi:hypothetical protein